MGKLLIRFGEISLKGKNRGYFENMLYTNIKSALAGLPGCRAERTHSRVFVETADNETAEVLARLGKVFGIVSISPVIEVAPDMESIRQAALAEVRRLFKPGLTFKVETKRADKGFPLKSPEVSRQVGGFLLKNIPGLSVDVHQPDLLLEIEIREDAAYLFTEKLPGPGGLPVGVSGKALLLLSGGIDSPVAAWYALKRGVTLEAVHFHSPPFTSERSREKVVDLCRVLLPYGGPRKLHVVHFTEIQKELRQKCPERLMVTLMRRMMFRIADRLAQKRGALALYTGESLGQVASQTMESMNVIQRVTSLPVLRPLIGLDKEEIVAVARRIDTYPISVRPYEDCCTIFLPANPATRPRLLDVEEAEKLLDVEALVEDALVRTETVSPGKENGGI